jgi:hypothetical protein
MNSTSESSGSGKTQVPPDEALRTLRSGLVRVDNERALAYEQLAMFRSAKRNLIERHKKLLAHKLGEDDPRVLALEARRAAMEGELRDLEIARDQAAVSVPDVEPAGYAVHGFVRSPVRTPVPDVTVAVYDANGRIRSDFKPSTRTTDEKGYFQLVTPQLIETGEPRGMPDEEEPSISLELRCFDAHRKPLALDVPPLEAVQGQVDFRELRVDVSTTASPSPPKAVPRERRSPGRPPQNPRSILQAMTQELRASRRSPQVASKKSPKAALKKTRRRKRK